MRNRVLHDALREFALESAALLCDDQRAGAELQFDVIEEQHRGGPALYRYVPLIDSYIDERWERLRSLPSCPAASSALGAGASDYLRLNGLRGGEPEPALRAMLERLYEDATSFAFPEERFESVYEEVERTLYRDSTRTTIAAPLRGVQLEPERVELGDGLALVREDALENPPETGEEPYTWCVLERDTLPGDPPLIDEAAQRFCALVTGLRLYKPGAVGLGGLGWSRPAGGRWQPLELIAVEGLRGEPWILVEGEDAELREFLEAAARSRHAGAVNWALGRFEMGCSRDFDAEALSDYLLALRALLDAGSEAGQASLSLRLAALCAEEGERRLVQRRVELALALERFVMAGGRDEDYVERIGSESPRMLVSEMERHLRALLRDVICGYLDPDLKGIADDILLTTTTETPAPEPPSAPERDPITEELEAVESATLRARRLMPARGLAEARRAETPVLPPDPPLPDPEPEPQPEPEPEPQPEPEPELGEEPDYEPDYESVAAPDGVTPSADWDDYSAPV